MSDMLYYNNNMVIQVIRLREKYFVDVDLKVLHTESFRSYTLLWQLLKQQQNQLQKHWKCNTRHKQNVKGVFTSVVGITWPGLPWQLLNTICTQTLTITRSQSHNIRLSSWAGAAPWWVSLSLHPTWAACNTGCIKHENKISIKPKYTTYCNATKGGLSHSHRQHAQIIWWSLFVWFLRYCRKKQTDRQTDMHITTLCSRTGAEVTNNQKCTFFWTGW